MKVINSYDEARQFVTKSVEELQEVVCRDFKLRYDIDSKMIYLSTSKKERFSRKAVLS
ncbi:hypothetical protein [Geomicrobium sediminis]|uniref:Uncharacterized protein n=1 Tax=Geomicrobium sediminis TaxID=1347788 RepID=A0ABS2P6P2_9BACL|nr:hypothetical protein [Geomicrobium sediminis]MBM7631016.1 hypothetical protein [Geomicrobium sediminis]